MVGEASLELLVRLLTEYQEELFRYIFALLPHEEDARDVLQETSVALYRKFDEYDPARPFLAWAYRFAYLEALKQRDRNARNRRHLSQEVVALLTREREPHEPVLQARLLALDDCLSRLPAEDGELIRRCYHDRAHIDELVRLAGTSRRTLFRRLERIRKALFDCVTSRVAERGVS